MSADSRCGHEKELGKNCIHCTTGDEIDEAQSLNQKLENLKEKQVELIAKPIKSFVNSLTERAKVQQAKDKRESKKLSKRFSIRDLEGAKRVCEYFLFSKKEFKAQTDKEGNFKVSRYGASIADSDVFGKLNVSLLSFEVSIDLALELKQSKGRRK